METKIRKQDALLYHSQGTPGKIEVVPTKMLSTQLDLALAYSPGVAEPCKKIVENPEDIYKYTAKGNLIGVISNGSAVLGLGNIGPEASKPVMEGKGVLFKKFAGIDVFDLEINCNDPDEFIKIVKSLEPTFGGINLEDIKSPESFYIEEKLRELLNIPVMHDDQHGTAIISAAAMINAIEIVGKKIDQMKFIINGAGAAAIACTRLYIQLGVRKENIVMLDSKGVIKKNRPGLSSIKAEFATNKNINTLEEAIKDADIFIGLSTGNILTQAMVKTMTNDPIVFALANPDPEISYDLAMAARDDLIMATGRSDNPNQVNNVLGFPYIFRGALDVRASEINETMKFAAIKALADLAKEPVPEMVNKAYGDKKFVFGKEYLIPKPLDPRLITTVSPAVAKAAMESGVANNPVKNWNNYHIQLLQRVGIDQKFISRIINRAKENPKKVVFAEADHYKILKASQRILDEGIAEPILLGNCKLITRLIKENNLNELLNCQILDPFYQTEKCEEYGRIFYENRKRKGVTLYDSCKLMRFRNYYGSMMVKTGEADALISGLSKDYPKTIKPALQAIGVEDGVNRVAGMYVIVNKKGTFFFADTTVNTNPTVDELVDIIALTARTVRSFDIEPYIAVLSYSNFGSSKGEVPEKAKLATQKVKEKYPDLIIEGDLQANIALNPQLQKEIYPFSLLAEKGANTLIFPNLASGNIAYKLLQELGDAEVTGPILMGMKKPVNILQLGSTVRDIVNMVAIAVVEAQKHNQPKLEQTERMGNKN